MNKDSKEMLLNAAMMQLRASATTCAATLEAILTSPTTTVSGTDYVPAIIENIEKLAHYDNAIRILHSTFISPMASNRRAETADNPERSGIEKARMDAFMKAAEAVNIKNAKTQTPKNKSAKKTKKHDMYADDSTDDAGV